MSILSRPEFHNEEAAYAYIEARLWPNGPTCPKCGETERVGKLKGSSTRIGVHKCYKCRKPFSVKVGTIFESSHVKMHVWLQAIYLMCASKKGISSNQLHRTLGVTLKTAWFMSHRIREAMRTGSFETPMGGDGKAVEVDETFLGRKKGATVKRGVSHKMAVLSLVQRDGEVRSFKIDTTKASEIGPIVNKNVAQESFLLTDDAKQYKSIGKDYQAHLWVNHSAGQYVDGPIHTNTIEGFFSIFKRGMKGIYQHCSEKHLHRYLAEYDFRYNNRIKQGVDDKERAEKALIGVVGKRLTYRRPNKKVKYSDSCLNY